MAIDLNRACRLNPRAALRPEPFGALVYHFGTRRLSFLETRQLVTVVLTDACNLQCVHCLSWSGRRDPAAKFFTGLPLDGPDPQCVLGHGDRELAKVRRPDRPQVGPGHSRRSAPVLVPLGRIPARAAT